MRIYCLFLFCLLFSLPLFAQYPVKIKGKVTDSISGEPIPFANVFVPGKFIGTTSDTAGNYAFSVPKKTDSITVQVIGYKSQTKFPNAESGQTLNFQLRQEDMMLSVITVKPGENPADVLMRQIIARKKFQTVNAFSQLQWQAYTKYQIDLDNISKNDLEDSKLVSLFPHIKDYIDTVGLKGRAVLPIFISENLADMKFKRPSKTQETIKAIRFSGIQQEDLITELLGNVNQNFDIYENLMSVMGKNFVSPIADYSLNIYKYNLNYFDTLYIDGEPHSGQSKARWTKA